MIINAAVHRSYLDHGNIQIAIYDNRLEITSPGKIPMGQSLERMKEGYSQNRNEALAYAFSYMNLIEHWDFRNLSLSAEKLTYVSIFIGSTLTTRTFFNMIPVTLKPPESCR